MDLNLIRKLVSPHRFAAFIARNYAEINKGKTRIVYNYKCLNDNIYNDAYNLAHKDSILNLI